MKREFWHNTDDQVEEFIRKGADLVDALGLPDDLRQVGFQLAVGLYSARQIQYEQVIPGVLDGRGRG